jgi:hypothetical protein
MNGRTMPRDEQTKLTPHAIFGVVIALMGVIFTLDNLGLADTATFVRFWPVLPVIVGVIMLMHADTVREWVFGSVWMAVGGVLLARSLGWLSFRLQDFLPLLLVAVGVRLIWHDQQRRAVLPPPPAHMPPDVELSYDESPPIPPIPPPPPPFASSHEPQAEKRGGSRGGRASTSHDWQPSSARAAGCSPWLDWENWWHNRGRHVARARRWARGQAWQRWHARHGGHWGPRLGHIRMLALMSGVERRVRGEAFASAEMTAIMGACELDLRQAEMKGGEAHISAFALWGGLEIRVPEHWVVVNRSMALMGGVEDTTRHVDTPSRPRLFVHGFALMAGIEIKN